MTSKVEMETIQEEIKMLNSLLCSSPCARPKNLSDGLIQEFTNQSISHFERMIKYAELGNENIRLDECIMYLGVWSSIKGRGYDWDKLTNEEKNELVMTHDDNFGPEY